MLGLVILQPVDSVMKLFSLSVMLFQTCMSVSQETSLILIDKACSVDIELTTSLTHKYKMY